MQYRPISPRVSALFASSALALVSALSTAHGQAEGGIARDAKTRAPLECLHVALLDSSGRAVTHTVTDSLGRFMLEAPRAGRYRVRLEMFGWDPMIGPVDTLAEGGFKQRIYPVGFATMPLPEGALDSIALKAIQARAPTDRSKEMKARLEPYHRLRKYLRGLEDGGTWQSRGTDSTSVRMRYPQSALVEGVDGDVIARFIVGGKPPFLYGSILLVN